MKVFCKLCGLKMVRGYGFADHDGKTTYRIKKHYFCPSGYNISDSHFSGEWGLTHGKPNFFREKYIVGKYKITTFTYGQVSADISYVNSDTKLLCRLPYYLKYSPDLSEDKIVEHIKNFQIIN